MKIYLVERKLVNRWSDAAHSAVVAAHTWGEARGTVIEETREARSAWSSTVTTVTEIGEYTAYDTEPHVILLSYGPTA